jgi:hypothetical protein
MESYPPFRERREVVKSRINFACFLLFSGGQAVRPLQPTLGALLVL